MKKKRILTDLFGRKGSISIANWLVKPSIGYGV
jgi:hypothetical protein